MDGGLSALLLYALWAARVPIATTQTHTHAAGAGWYIGELGQRCSQVCEHFGLTCDGDCAHVDARRRLGSGLLSVWGAVPAENYVTGATTAMVCLTNRIEQFSTYPWYSRHQRVQHSR